jgi:alpha-beta hydrolase superfamily lysophospholipase
MSHRCGQFVLLSLCVLLLPRVMRASETVHFRSADGVNLVGTLSKPAAAPKEVLILLHMLGRDRSSWDDFAASAVGNGSLILSVDLRGHGESRTSDSGELDYTKFAPAEFGAMTADVAAAVALVHERTSARVILIGASIGANVALTYAATDTSVAAVVLLSPGDVYRGVMTKPAMTAYGARPALLVAAEDDNYSALSVGALTEINTVAETVVYPTGGHGTYLLESRPELTDRIFAFIQRLRR